MNRLDHLFKKKQHKILAIYCTAGFPQQLETITVLKSLQQHGADIVELGMPYSDPVADGEVIQQSSSIALKNGMTIELLLSQLKNCRTDFHLPLILMGYLNPILQYGFEKFCKEAADVGVDAFILPDLPPAEYEKQYRSVMKAHGLHFIMLVTPETSEERIRYIDNLSSSFIYAVTSSSTTGNKNLAVSSEYLQRLKQMNLKNPLLAGFGISDHETYQQVCNYCNGVIIGSAYVKALGTGNTVEISTAQFLKKILK